MTLDFALVPSALEADGMTFDEWSQELDRYRAAVPQPLEASDFSLIPGAQDVLAQYIKAGVALGTYIDSGSTMMDGFARTLLETVRIYMEAEDFAQADVDRVTTELEQL